MKKSIALLIGLCLLGLGNLAFAQAQNEIRHTVKAGETAYSITKVYLTLYVTILLQGKWRRLDVDGPTTSNEQGGICKLVPVSARLVLH